MSHLDRASPHRRAWGRFALLAALALGGCQLIEPMPGDQPCKEVGWAIAARTHACTGDVELANARYEDFSDQNDCVEWTADDERLGAVPPEDLFSCAFTIRNLPCETVTELGDDLDAWLALDEGCAYVVQPAGGDQ